MNFRFKGKENKIIQNMTKTLHFDYILLLSYSPGEIDHNKADF
jgi:hypothetical protein